MNQYGNLYLLLNVLPLTCHKCMSLNFLRMYTCKLFTSFNILLLRAYSVVVFDETNWIWANLNMFMSWNIILFLDIF